MRRAALLPLVLPALLAGCGGDDAGGGGAAPSPGPSMRGALPVERLQALLLRDEDLPHQPERRRSTSAAVSLQPVPQLALCGSAGPELPHQTVNVIAKAEPGEAVVFQVVSVYETAEDAARVFAQQATNPAQCPTYTADDGTPVTVTDLAPVEVAPPASAVHYRLETPDVVRGDVRTLAVSGRTVVLLSGYGEPPGGGDLLDYQARLLPTALERAAAAG